LVKKEASRTNNWWITKYYNKKQSAALPPLPWTTVSP